MDKRNSQRVTFTTTVEVLYKDKSITGTVENLSMKGLFVKTDTTVDINTHISLQIHLSGLTSKMSLEAEGVISRIDDSGFAISFKKMELDSYIILKNIIFYADDELHEYIEFL